MKKPTLILIVLLAASALALGAQSLKDNPDYQMSLELNAKAAQAFDAGDYDAAADFATQAKDYAARSDAYVEKMLAKDKADKAIAFARDKLAAADAVNAKDRYPNEYADATGHFQGAQDYYGNEAFPDAETEARAAAEAFDGIVAAIAKDDELAAAKAKADAEREAAERAARVLPSEYTVKRLASDTDCLWRIAGFPFVYNNPELWPKLYEANKKVLRDPANPNLVYPGQKLRIPSIKGEERSGAYDPAKAYIPLPKK
jgi:hypothetical protein